MSSTIDSIIAIAKLTNLNNLNSNLAKTPLGKMIGGSKLKNISLITSTSLTFD